MYKEVFKQIIEASQNNSLTFFVGAGISTVSGAPQWKDLIDGMCRELNMPIKEKYSSDEYLRIPQIFYYSINKDDERYYTFINGFFNRENLRPNDVHKMLLHLNPCSFITTNFDELLEDAAVQNTQSFTAVARDEDIPSINGERFILKVHGDLKHKNIVLKEEDYLNYSENFKLTETVLKSVFSMNTVVFIGYSLNDYNIKLILNWAKNLLKDQFNKPIFIHTGDEELSPEELLYHESKGVNVVECKKCSPDINKSTKYLERYQSVINAINAVASNNIEGKSDIEVFDVLYNLLLPLDRMSALRVGDIRNKLGRYVYVGDDNTISETTGTHNLLKYYLEVKALPEEKRTTLPLEIKSRYSVISSVFAKARITHIKSDKTYIEIGEPCTIADPYCIGFNSSKMQEFCNKENLTRDEKYKKAYYLAKLMRHEEAYFLFLDVAEESFKEKDYLLCYLSQVNCSNLLVGIRNQYMYYDAYDMEKIEESALTEHQKKHLFDMMPVTFKNAYPSLKHLTSAKVLYEYAYAAFIDGEKLQNVIESNTMEFGLTSSDKAICRINDHLHFFIGNGLYLDEFNEFKFAIRYIMGMLIYKYTEQNKIRLSDNMFPGLANSKVIFDELDFYCFVEYFDSKSLQKLFSKHNIQTIEFQNTDRICDAITNLLDFYENSLARSASNIERISYQVKLKTCLTLMRFMDIPQKIVDKVCKFIFAYDFREILINDKILFLDRKIYKDGKVSEFTDKIIENILIWHLDEHIKAVKNGKKYDGPLSTSSLNYNNLVHYISPKSGYHSRRLALRISQIMQLNDAALTRHLINDYSQHVSNYQKAKIVAWAKQTLEENFNFEMFCLLINNKAKISSLIRDSLCQFLREKVNTAKEEAAKPHKIHHYPETDYLLELNHVGFLCLLGDLPKKSFDEFVGVSDKFDFYYMYRRFDFSKFDVAWLFDLSDAALKAVSKDKVVRNRIRAIIIDELLKNKFKVADAKRLSKILMQYFC